MEEQNQPTPNSPYQKNQPKKSGFFAEVLKFFFIVLFVIIPFRIFIAQPFIVEGASMDPIFSNGEYLIVDQLTYRFSEPERGSVLIFKYPRDHKQFFIKRVIGLPGERVEMKKGVITIFNAENPNGFKYDQPFILYDTKDSKTLTLGEGEYFVLGDNRPVSSDSRSWNAVDEDEIIGRPFLRLLPFREMGVLPGDFSD